MFNGEGSGGVPVDTDATTARARAERVAELITAQAEYRTDVQLPLNRGSRRSANAMNSHPGRDWAGRMWDPAGPAARGAGLNPPGSEVGEAETAVRLVRKVRAGVGEGARQRGNHLLRAMESYVHGRRSTR